MSNILQKIEATKLQEVERLKGYVRLNEIKVHKNLKDPCRDFVGSIKKNHLSGRSSVIAEIKKASPSKGVIREKFNPVDIARSYEEYGAACLSILTDKKFFQGDDKFIKAVKSKVSLPVLRKDFIIDEWQIEESRYLGADCILLIMAVLNIEDAILLEKEAIDLGMDVLIETHTEEEVKMANKLKSKLVGVNNRNLKTMEVDINNTLKLKNFIDPEKFLVAESGLKTHLDLQWLKENGIINFLIGESLMKEKDLTLATKKILGIKN